MPDPNWPRASEWLAGDHHPDAIRRIAVLGAPLHLGSITPGRCDLAPGAIRKGLERFSTFDAESDSDLLTVGAADLGDLDLANARPEEALAPLSDAVRSSVSNAETLVLLGGDNSITRPGCYGAATSLGDLGLLTLDAHLDLRDIRAGLSNGNPVRALLADGLPGSQIVQLGIAPFANSRAYADVAREAGITVVPIEAVRAKGIDAAVREALTRLAERVDTIYVDLDMDVLDRAFAPGAPGARPGGLSPAEIFGAAKICGQHSKVRALDIVEVDPTRDVADVTVLAAARCLLAFTSGVAGRAKRE